MNGAMSLEFEPTYSSWESSTLSMVGHSLNFSNDTSDESTEAPDDSFLRDFLTIFTEKAIPAVFAIIGIVGLTGNALVLRALLFSGGRRSRGRLAASPTNVLVLSLSTADLLFLVLCVPTTPLTYAGAWRLPLQALNTALCRLSNYMIFVAYYAAVYTLLVIAADRTLSVVAPVVARSWRRARVALCSVAIVWVLSVVGNLVVLSDFEIKELNEKSYCLNTELQHNAFENSLLSKVKIYYLIFFVLGFIVPLLLFCALYGVMITRLLHGRVAISRRAMRSKRRIATLVVCVVVCFVLCWSPVQVLFMIEVFWMRFVLQHDLAFFIIQVCCNCAAYMNSCINPFIYGLLSRHYRSAFRRCCRRTLSLSRHSHSGDRGGIISPPLQNHQHLRSHLENCSKVNNNNNSSLSDSGSTCAPSAITGLTTASRKHSHSNLASGVSPHRSSHPQRHLSRADKLSVLECDAHKSSVQECDAHKSNVHECDAQKQHMNFGRHSTIRAASMQSQHQISLSPIEDVSACNSPVVHNGHPKAPIHICIDRCSEVEPFQHNGFRKATTNENGGPHYESIHMMELFNRRGTPQTTSDLQSNSHGPKNSTTA